MSMEMIYSGTLTIILLNHWHTTLMGPIDPQTVSQVLSTNPSSLLPAHHFSLLTVCMLLALKNSARWRFQTYSFILLSSQVSSSLSCEISPPSSVCLLSLLTVFVSKPMCIPFLVFTWISAYTCLAPEAICKSAVVWVWECQGPCLLCVSFVGNLEC